MRASLAVALPLGNELFENLSLARILEVAVLAEEAGVDTLTTGDHVLLTRGLDQFGGWYPLAPETPFLEPLTLFGAIASATKRVRFSTEVLLAALRPAALLAKTAATLDVLSAGRLELGVGVGWQREEFESVGVDFHRRGQVLTDTIAACRALWTASPASFSSETVVLKDVWVEPRPVQPEGPPILFAGRLYERNLERIVRLGNGWIPFVGAGLNDVAEGARQLRERWQASGRSDRLLIRVSLPVANTTGAPDLEATLGRGGEFVAAGATELRIRVGDFVKEPGRLAEWFDELRQVRAAAF